MCGALLCLAAPLAQAGTIALDIIANNGNTGTNSAYSLGWRFQVNSPILVDSLGFFDNIITQNHDVGIWDNGQNLLVTATVLPGDPQSGTAPWRFHAIAPLSLSPGTYYIAAETGDDRFTSGPTSMTTAPEITFLNDQYVASPVLTFPTQSSGGGLQAYFGPTFTFTTGGGGGTPEPATFAMMGAGLLAVVGLARRRRR
jgi:hypothetical protein